MDRNRGSSQLAQNHRTRLAFYNGLYINYRADFSQEGLETVGARALPGADSSTPAKSQKSQKSVANFGVTFRDYGVSGDTLGQSSCGHP